MEIGVADPKHHPSAKYFVCMPKARVHQRNICLQVPQIPVNARQGMGSRRSAGGDSG
jgi:hypothetical protein